MEAGITISKQEPATWNERMSLLIIRENNLSIWRENAYHTWSEKQLTEYLNHYHLDKGYMLSFNFNQKKTIGVKEIRLGDKILIEAVCSFLNDKNSQNHATTKINKTMQQQK